MAGDSPNSADTDIDTEMYLRDGFPHAVVCKVQLRDGRIGIGIARQNPASPGALGDQAMDKAALDDALENVPERTEPGDGTEIEKQITADEADHDLQASLGQPAKA